MSSEAPTSISVMSSDAGATPVLGPDEMKGHESITVLNLSGIDTTADRSRVEAEAMLTRVPAARHWLSTTPLAFRQQGDFRTSHTSLASATPPSTPGGSVSLQAFMRTSSFQAEALLPAELSLMKEWYGRTQCLIHALNEYVKYQMMIKSVIASCLIVLPSVCSFTAKRHLFGVWWMSLLLSGINLFFIALSGILQPSLTAEGARTAVLNLQNVLVRMDATVLRYKRHDHPERIMNGILVAYAAATKMTPTIPSSFTAAAAKVNMRHIDDPQFDCHFKAAMESVPENLQRQISATKIVVAKNRTHFTHQANWSKFKGSLLATGHTLCGIIQNVALLVEVTAAKSHTADDLVQQVALLGVAAGYAAAGLAGFISTMQYYQQENICRGEAQQFSEWTRKLELLELNRLCINSVPMQESEALAFLATIKERIDNLKRDGVSHEEFPTHPAHQPLLGHSSTNQ